MVLELAAKAMGVTDQECFNPSSNGNGAGIEPHHNFSNITV